MGASRSLVSLSTACLFPRPLEAILAIAAEAGFEGVELVLAPESRRLGAAQTARRVADAGLKLATVHQPLWPLGEWRRLSARMRSATDFGAELGCAAVVVHCPELARWSDPAARAWLAAIEHCRHALAGSPTRLALENITGHGAGGRCLLDDPAELARFVAERGLHATLDTCHAGATPDGLWTTYAALRPHLANVHWSDRRRNPRQRRDGRLVSMLRHHQMPGAGDLPLAAFLARLAQDGYDGPLSVEVNPVMLHAWSRRQALARLRQVRAFLRAPDA